MRYPALAFSVIAMAAWPSSGCIIASNNTGFCGDSVKDDFEACDDGNTSDGDGCSSTCQIELATLTAAWSFENIATGTTSGCPTGFDTAVLVSQEIDADGNTVGSQVSDPFDCALLTGQSSPLPFGIYASFVQITNDDQTSIYATSLSEIVDLTTGNRTAPTQVIFNDGGFFHVTWTLQGTTSGTTLTCAQANHPDSIVIQTTSATSVVAQDSFHCDDGEGVTAGYLAGTYTVTAGAKSNNMALGTPTALPGETIGLQNHVTDLGTVIILIDGQ